MEDLAISNVFAVGLVVAFGFGFAARQVGLPPLVGFLAAGFVLNGFGVHSDDTLQVIADTGVTLLLFTIGLKLKIKSLLRPEVWGTASLHALLTTAGLGLVLLVLGVLGLPLVAGMGVGTAIVVGFALSFSSTVFAVKVLEAKGELASLHGRTAIGILIVQDVFAVVFLTASTGKLPEPWAPALILLIYLRPILFRLLDRVGHGELLPLFGFFAALALGVEIFDLAGLKADLGALAMGMLLAGHRKASEIADSLFSFKEIFLVGFFLNIGLSGLPGPGALLMAVFLVLLLPGKAVVFLAILTRLRLRVRTATLASLVLSNYSEFGLIVGAIAVANGWIGTEWVVAIAIAMSISFAAAAPFNARAHTVYARLQEPMARYEPAEVHPEERVIDTGDAQVAIFGMGRIGTGAYDYLREKRGDVIAGFDVDPAKIADHLQAGRNVILGDATDPDFWFRHGRPRFDMVMLAMPEHDANMHALVQLRSGGYAGYIAALAQYPDRAEELDRAGADVAFSTYAEAGAGFAAHVESSIGGPP